MSADLKHQKIALAICEFLNQSIEKKVISTDDAEGIEVAVQCIAEAFGVDPSDSAQVKELSIKPASLLTVFDVVLKTQNKAVILFIFMYYFTIESLSFINSWRTSLRILTKFLNLHHNAHAFQWIFLYIQKFIHIVCDEPRITYQKDSGVDPKKNAEELKALGNAKMSEKNYLEAVNLYTQAIALDPSNAVYYANR